MRLYGGCGTGCDTPPPAAAEKFRKALQEILKYDPSFSWQIAREALQKTAME
jgi:hypothetical protein